MKLSNSIKVIATVIIFLLASMVIQDAAVAGAYQPLDMGPEIQSKKGPLVVNRNNSTIPWGFLVPFGNVGIGTTDQAYPTSKLTIRDDSGGQVGQLNFDALVTNSYTASFLLDDIGLKIGHGSGIRAIQLLTGNALNQMTPRLTITSPNGFVGIGTTNPTAQLHTTDQVRFENLGSSGLANDLDNVYIDGQGSLKRGKTYVTGQFTVPTTQAGWSFWQSLPFEPSVIAFSSLPNQDRNCVYTGTVALPENNGSTSVWAYISCQGADRHEQMTVEKNNNSFRVRFSWDGALADMSYTAFR